MELIVRDAIERKQPSDKFIKGRTNWEWELVLSGIWASSPAHGGRVIYEAAHNDDGTVWALRARQGKIVRVTAVMVDPDTKDEEVIVQQLLEATEQAPQWFFIDSIKDRGRFYIEHR